MSIFSGLSLENLQIAMEAAKRSPKALAALAIVAVVAVAAVGFEDERARMEEEQAAKNAAQEENHQKGETQ